MGHNGPREFACFLAGPQGRSKYVPLWQYVKHHFSYRGFTGNRLAGISHYFDWGLEGVHRILIDWALRGGYTEF